MYLFASLTSKKFSEELFHRALEFEAIIKIIYFLNISAKRWKLDGSKTFAVVRVEELGLIMTYVGTHRGERHSELVTATRF